MRQGQTAGFSGGTGTDCRGRIGANKCKFTRLQMTYKNGLIIINGTMEETQH